MSGVVSGGAAGAFLRLVVRDTAHSIRVWLSAAVVFLALGFSTAVLCLMCTAIADAQSIGSIGAESASGLWSIWGMHVFLTVVVGFTAVSGTLRQVFDARSEILARLSLAGAPPAQCALIFAMQIAAAILVGMGIGIAVAWPLMGVACQWIMTHVAGLHGVLTPRYSHTAILVAMLCLLGISFAATAVRARRQLRVTPAQQVQLWRNPQARTSWIRLVFAIALAGGLVGLVWPTVGAARSGRMVMSADSFVPAGMGVSALAAIVCVVAGPYCALGIVRACTRLLPHSAVGRLALRAFTDRPAQALAAINPMTLCVALPLGVIAPAWTLASALNAHTGGGSSVRADMSSLFTLCALPLLIALSTALASLIMEGRRQRESMILSALAGATPVQQVMQQVLQAIIAVCAASVQAAFCIWLGSWWTAQVMAPTFGAVPAVFPLKWWLLSSVLLLGACALIELVITVPHIMKP